MITCCKEVGLAGALVLGLVAMTSVCADAVAPQPPSDVELRALMHSFSGSRRVNTQKSGAEIYAAVCAGCHMAGGEGATGSGSYPALRSNPKLASGTYAAMVVIAGLHGMPAFAQRLDDAQIAAVVNYLGTHFGYPGAERVTVQQVSRLRLRMAPESHSSYD